MIRPALLRPFLPAAAMALALSGCGSSSGNPPTAPTPTPPPITNPTPTPTPDFRAQCSEPMPPPLYGMKVSVQVDNGFRKLVDSKPVVENVGRGNPSESYCGKVGFDWRAAFCETRQEGNPQRPACDALVVGQSAETGRFGPTWEWNGKPCQSAGEQQEGCVNHSSNQFLVIARGEGSLLACASGEWPASGARCGGCDLKINVSTCLQ